MVDSCLMAGPVLGWGEVNGLAQSVEKRKKGRPSETRSSAAKVHEGKRRRYKRSLRGERIHKFQEDFRPSTGGREGTKM